MQRKRRKRLIAAETAVAEGWFDAGDTEDAVYVCQELLSQYCGVHTYILALAEYSSSSSITDNKHRQLHPILPLFLVLNYLPLAHNLNTTGLFLKDELQT